MKILLLNQKWFDEELRAAGHEVISCGYSDGMDVRLEIPLLHIDSVIKMLPNNFQPDLIIWNDNSAPILFSGLEETDIPLIFYSVDSHHHLDLHISVAPIFDKSLVAQKDYIPQFFTKDVDVDWFPLWASRFVEASDQKKYKTSFVGTMNPILNPDRVQFFDRLKQLTEIHIDRGEFWNIFPFSEIVVNQTVKGDLNFRVFEAMMCGSLLLTERTGNGLLDLFIDREHLVTYEKNNAEEAANTINELVGNLKKCREIAHAGREEILKKHTTQHRATDLLKIINTTKRTSNKKRFLGAMVNYSALSPTLAKQDSHLQNKALIATFRAAEQALTMGEVPSEVHSLSLITSSVVYQRNFRSDAATNLIERYAEAFPSDLLLTHAKIRNLLNTGRVQEATELAKSVGDGDVKSVFSNAEKMVAELLDLTQAIN